MSTTAAPFYELVIPQGATFTRTVTWKDAAGDPIPLSGYTARAMIRESYDAESPLVSMSSEGDSPMLVISGSLGRITMTIPDSVTETLDFTSAVWDLEVESSSGVVTRLLQGTAWIDKEATK